MKGSALVLLGCFALFFAAPSRSYSISEDDQLANRQGTQPGSPSTDAATSGDAVENTDTSDGEIKTVKMIGDASPGDGSVAGGAQAEKTEIRKRDTRSLFRDETDTEQITGMPPIAKETALYLFRRLGKYGSKCLEQAFDYIEEHEMPVGFVEDWYPEAVFTRSHMIKWLRIMKDTVSECLVNSINQLSSEDRNSEDIHHRNDTPDSVGSQPESDTFDNVPQFLSPLIDIGKTLKKCLEDAIRYLEATSHNPADTVQRSSKSLPDLLTELIEILSLIEGKVPGGDTVPMSPPGHTGAPHLDSVPVTTTYKKRNSPDKPGECPHYSNLPGSPHGHYIYSKDTLNSVVPQSSEFRKGAAQIPYTPGITTLPGDLNAHPAQQLSLLNIVLDKIYSKLQGNVPPAVNMEAAPVAGLRVDANGALGVHPGNGESPATGNPGCNRECVHERMQ